MWNWSMYSWLDESQVEESASSLFMDQSHTEIQERLESHEIM